MIPAIFPLVTAPSLGTNPKRFFMFGDAPSNVDKPYATWQVINASPENYLDKPPDMDNPFIQIDVWADTAGQAGATATQIRDDLEPHMHMTSYGSFEREADTQLYRIRMDFSLFEAR